MWFLTGVTLGRTLTSASFLVFHNISALWKIFQKNQIYYLFDFHDMILLCIWVKAGQRVSSSDAAAPAEKRKNIETQEENNLVT